MKTVLPAVSVSQFALVSSIAAAPIKRVNASNDFAMVNSKIEQG
jgi:hypothetical protein